MWNFPDKNTGVGCHFLLQGIFPTQGLSPRLLHILCWQVDSLPLCHSCLVTSNWERVGRIHDPEELEREVWTWEQKGLIELQLCG